MTKNRPAATSSEAAWLSDVSENEDMDKEIEVLVGEEGGYGGGEVRKLLEERDQKHRAELDLLDERHREEKKELETKLMGEIKSLREDVDEINDFASANFLEPGMGGAQEKQEDEEETELIDLPILPCDTFSLLAFSKAMTTSMVTAIGVFIVQSVALSLLAFDILSGGSPGNLIGAPARVSPATSTIQVLALFIGVFSQTDFQDSLNCLLIGFDEDDMKYHFGNRINRCRWLFCHLTRIFVSALGLMVMFCLIVSESDPTELLLDFTAIEFITNLDNIFFWLAAWGYMGFRAQQDATRVVTAKPCHLVVVKHLKQNEDGTTSKRKKSLKIIPSIRNAKSKQSFRPAQSVMVGKSIGSIFTGSDFMSENERIKSSKDFRLPFLVLFFLIELTGWAYYFYQQLTGAYLCQTIFVQFHDEVLPEMATFSGLYDYTSGQALNFRCDGACTRGQYIESSINPAREKAAARFGYCDEVSSWVFSYGDNSINVTADYEPPLICDWKAKSTEIDPLSDDSYDIITSASNDWFIRNQRKVVVPMSGITLKCFDCSNDDLCGEDEGRGKCVNNRCVCEEGWHGLGCEFFEPCKTLNIDDLFDPFESTQTWPTRFNILKKDFDDLNSSIVEVNNRPIYVSSDMGADGIIFYNGRRWGMAKAVNIPEIPKVFNQNDLAKYFSDSFHAYWSTYGVAFLSEPVDADTPEDSNTPAALTWFEAELKHQENVQGLNKNKKSVPVNAKLLCSTCDDDTNPCEYEGKCVDGTCQCTTGSSGTLCQIPPLGNAVCDLFFNTPQFNYDGGDCCEESCVSVQGQSCGFGSVGVDASGYIGFKNCTDPEIANKIEGSRTLYEIETRGYVICGTYSSTVPGFDDFCRKQCEAIAAAVFGDKSKIEMLIWDNNRFNELKDGMYDVIFGSDYTFNRDVYEASSRSPFSYVTIPYMFAGLTFAGKAPYGLCADRLEFNEIACQQLKICIEGATTFSEFVEKNFPSDMIVQLTNLGVGKIDALNSGVCNVIGGYAPELSFQNVANNGYIGSEEEYQAGSRLHIKSFETWLTVDNDRVWNRFVTWIMEALVQAEESGVTNSTADTRMATTEVFGLKFRNMFRNAVKANGNYGKLWENFDFVRAGLNLLNDGTSGIMLAMDLGNFGDFGPEPAAEGRLAAIQKRGSLRCGVVPRAGFAVFDDETRTWTGFEVDICKGIAAAIFGHTQDGGVSKADVSSIDAPSRWNALVTEEIDIYIGFTRTLEREVKFSEANNAAFDFGPPYFHDGMVFSGPLPYGKCAEDLNFTEGECVNTKICVVVESTWDDNVRNLLGVPDSNVYPVETFSDAFKRHVDGTCNVIAGELSYITSENLENEGYIFDGVDYYFGTIKHSKEPLCIMTTSSDSQFSDFLRWVMYGYIHAEEKGITDSVRMPETLLFGEELKSMWKNSIAEVGNYGTMYERNLERLITREGLNKLNIITDPGPQVFSAPGTLK